MPDDISEALSIVHAVLSEYGASISDEWNDDLPPEWIDNLAVCLLQAGADRSVAVSMEHLHEKRHTTRLQRIRDLEDLLQTYRSPNDRMQARAWLRNRHGVDLDHLLRDMRALLQAEKLIDATQPRGRQNRRPPEAKNESAEHMLRILCAEGIVDDGKSGAWKGSGIIAEMYIRLGIEERTPEKVQRSLYNKLSRSID